ncbi:MAG: SLC13 family permease [Peptococcaceae bacterium]|nr:SLC13 family permease [Peptococcaceae bacterium]
MSEKKNSMMYYFHCAMVFILTFGFGYIPPVEPLTEMGMKILGIFFGCLYGWVFVDLIWPSLLGMIAIVLTGYMNLGGVLKASFGAPLIIMLIFILIFCAILDHHGLSRFISLWFITRKSVLGKPWTFTFIFLLSIALLSGLTSAVAATVIGWSILYSISDVLGYKRTDGYNLMMIFGLAFSSQIGMSLIPFKNVPLAVLGAWENMSGQPVDYMKYMLIAAVCTFIAILVYLAIAKFVFRPDVSKLKELSLEKMDVADELVLSKTQKIVFGFFAVLIVMLVWPSFGPKEWFITTFINNIGTAGTVMLIIVLMMIVRPEGKPLFGFKEMVNQGVMWGIILLLAVVQPISTAMSDEVTGITAFLVNIMQPVFEGRSSIMFVIVIGLAATIITNFVNNIAVGVALMPVIYAYASSLGFNGEIASIMVAMCVLLALLTPSASSSAALLHGNEYLDKKYLVKASVYSVLLTFIAFAVVITVMSMFLF